MDAPRRGPAGATWNTARSRPECRRLPRCGQDRWIKAQIEAGHYTNDSEYIRDLIRRDKDRAEQEAFDRLKAELTHAYAAPEASYRPLTSADVIARNRT